MFCKTLWKSLALVKLLYAYSSTKDKLLLKYFIRKAILKNTSMEKIFMSMKMSQENNCAGVFF